MRVRLVLQISQSGQQCRLIQMCTKEMQQQKNAGVYRGYRLLYQKDLRRNALEDFCRPANY